MPEQAPTNLPEGEEEGYPMLIYQFMHAQVTLSTLACELQTGCFSRLLGDVSSCFCFGCGTYLERCQMCCNAAGACGRQHIFARFYPLDYTEIDMPLRASRVPDPWSKLALKYHNCSR